MSRVSSAVRCASAKQRLLQHPPAPLRRASQHAGGRLYTLPNPQSAGAACCAGGCLIRGRWGEAKLSVQGCLSPASSPGALGCFRVVLDVSESGTRYSTDTASVCPKKGRYTLLELKSCLA